jgi:hypothetical protein
MIGATEFRVEQRVAHLEGRAMEQSHIFDDIRENMADIRQVLRGIDDKSSRYFMWLVGIQTTILLALVALLRR